MKAAILVAQHQHLVLDDVDLPRQLHHGQVLVRVAFSSICGSQLGEIDGVKGPDRYLPHLLGHEGSGIVEDTGPGVKRVHRGDHVVLHWMKGDGIESETPRYSWMGRALNAGWVTTFNEYAIVSENRLTPIPHSLDLEVATLLGCAVTTGLGVVTNNARLQIGESAVVLGAGGVGLNVIQGAAMVSAYPIVAVDLFDGRLELARAFGASHTVNASYGDTEAELRAIVGHSGADVVVETTGNVAVIQQAYALTAPRGRTVLVGVPRHDQDISIHSLPLHFGRVLTGSHGGETDPARDIPRLARLFEAGKLKLRELLTERYTLEGVNEAITGMRDGSTLGRCLISVAP